MSGEAHIVPLSARLYDELDEAQRRALDALEPVEPTPDERRNGWTAETLGLYLAGRAAGAAVHLDPASMHRRAARRSSEQRHRYNPLRWRG